MIVGYWKPITKVINGKQTKIAFTITENLNSNTLAVWTCDDINCKTPSLRHTIRYTHLSCNISDKCNLNIQICKSCQQRGSGNNMYGRTHSNDIKNILKQNIIKSFKTIKKRYGVSNISQLDEIKLKKNQIVINYENVNNIIIKENYTLISLNGNNKHSELIIKCPNNHIFKMKYLSWKRGHRCIECHYERLRSLGISNIEGFEKYCKIVNFETRQSMKLYKNDINPMNYELGRGKYHIDHKYSKMEGFKQNIDPKIIGSKHNIEIITESDNCSKQDKCSITKEELFNEYNKQN